MTLYLVMFRYVAPQLSRHTLHSELSIIGPSSAALLVRTKIATNTGILTLLVLLFPLPFHFLQWLVPLHLLRKFNPLQQQTQQNVLLTNMRLTKKSSRISPGILSTSFLHPRAHRHSAVSYSTSLKKSFHLLSGYASRSNKRMSMTPLRDDCSKFFPVTGSMKISSASRTQNFPRCH